MKKLLALLICINLIFLSVPVSASSDSDELPECVVISHCVRKNWKVSNLDEAFTRAAKLIAETPRTKIIDQTDSYIHAEATTKWMHYVDDLEVKALERTSTLQVRSESRVGIGDNGVNKKRIDDLAYRMSINK
tara:strand:+ start:1548 stop:1946 length:399 start_codon:yes stop_codon:yes gene_type:complete